MKPNLPPEILSTTTVLAVDDHEPTLEFLTRALRYFGFENVIGVSDPRDAAERFKELQPELVLVDCRMPFMDGFELVEKLRKQKAGREVAVLMLSGSVDDESRERALDHGVDKFIPKPVMLPDLASAITDLLCGNS